MSEHNTATITQLKEAGKMPARTAGAQTLGQFFSSKKDVIAQVLPKHLTPDRMMRIALHAVRTTPALQECTIESLAGAVIQAASLGLEPNTVTGDAYLVPFQNRKKGVKEAQLIPGYRGLMKLARQSGDVVSISAHEVRENDVFEMEFGTEEKLKHVPAWKTERGEIVLFYAVAHFKDGGHHIEFMTMRDVEKIRDGSQGYRFAFNKGWDNPWIERYIRDKNGKVTGTVMNPEMGRKTVIRRIAKFLPLSMELQSAIELDDAAHTGKGQGLDFENVIQGDYEIEPAASEEEAAESPRSASTPEASTDGLGGAEEGGDGDPGASGDEWPRKGDNGQWIDAAGEVYDEDRHAWSKERGRPAVKQDNTFAARRGRPANHQEAPSQKPEAEAGDEFGNIE